MATTGPTPSAPATKGRRIGFISIPTAFLLLFLYEYGGVLGRWAFGPSAPSLPDGISISLVDGKYEAGTQASAIGLSESYANLSFNVVVDNHGCDSCRISEVTVSLAESPREAPFQVIHRPLKPRELGVGGDVILAVSAPDVTAAAAQKIVMVELLSDAGQKSNLVGKRAITIPGLENVRELWNQSMFSGGQATVSIPDQ